MANEDTVRADLEKPLDELFLGIAVRLTEIQLQRDARLQGIQREPLDKNSVVAALRRSLGVQAERECLPLT